MSVSVSIDIDGTLADSFSLYNQIAKEEGVEGNFSEKYNGLWQVYTKDNEVFGNILFGKHKDRLIEDVKPISGALKGYKKFVESDHIIPYIVTSREETFKEQTQRWLKKHGFTGYEDLLFYKDKLKAPTQVAIDDRPITLQNYIDNARMAICIDAPYNREFSFSHRAQSMEQAFQILMPHL